MNKIDEILKNLELNLPQKSYERQNDSLNLPFNEIKDIEAAPGKYCGVDEISDIFSWKKGFSYLFTGSPNTGKTTMVLYLYLIMAKRYGWKFCVWSPEMIDVDQKGKDVLYHAKDLIYLLIWTLYGKTPYAFYAQKHGCDLLTDEEIESAYSWITEHIHFLKINDRTPSGIIDAFNDFHSKHNYDGFLLDPWKNVKQNITGRSDIWLEDVLFEFKKFQLETNTVLSYIVHPKGLKDYKDADDNFRVITPFDLNGGAAWQNSMDVIVSLRRLDVYTEWHSQKVRKEHLIGQRGSYEKITFDKDTYRFYFDGNDPI